MDQGVLDIVLSSLASPMYSMLVPQHGTVEGPQYQQCQSAAPH